MPSARGPMIGFARTGRQTALSRPPWTPPRARPSTRRSRRPASPRAPCFTSATGMRSPRLRLGAGRDRRLHEERRPRRPLRPRALELRAATSLLDRALAARLGDPPVAPGFARRLRNVWFLRLDARRTLLVGPHARARGRPDARQGPRPRGAVACKDIGASVAMISVIGPRAGRLMAAAGLPDDLAIGAIGRDPATRRSSRSCARASAASSCSRRRRDRRAVVAAAGGRRAARRRVRRLRRAHAAGAAPPDPG